MNLRLAASALMACGTALLAGCPLGFNLGFPLGSASDASPIPDGVYRGGVDGVFEIWNGDELYDEGEEPGATDATFVNGALLKDSGGKFRVGDVDVLEDGAYVIQREVHDIEVGDWGYEIHFDLVAEWNSIPMVGWEIATYELNADGTLDLFDEIELVSEDGYDGGNWLIHSDAYATLERDAAPAPQQPVRNILDLKSGKIRR